MWSADVGTTTYVSEFLHSSIPAPRWALPRKLGSGPGKCQYKRGARRDHRRRRARLPRRSVRVPARRARVQLPVGRHADGLPRLGRRRRLRLHRHGARPRPERADDAGLPAPAGAEAEALRDELPPAGAATRRRAASSRAGVARRRRKRAERCLRLADRRLARAGGVGHDGHPGHGPSQPRADPHGGRLGGTPAAEGLSDRRRARPLLRRRMTLAPERPRIYEGTRIPSPVPTILQVPPETEDVLQVNFGPNHPSTHGVLRLVIDLHGETVVGLQAVIGYLHTGFEKNMEQKTWWKAITYPERIDYLAFQNNELVFVLAIEKLLGIEVPGKATWMRMLLCELNRIHSHLVWLGTSGLELGATSMFWYRFREREQIPDLSELVTGARMHTRYFQAGGLAEDIPLGFYTECRRFVDYFPRRIGEYEA